MSSPASLASAIADAAATATRHPDQRPADWSWRFHQVCKRVWLHFTQADRGFVYATTSTSIATPTTTATDADADGLSDLGPAIAMFGQILRDHEDHLRLASLSIPTLRQPDAPLDIAPVHRSLLIDTETARRQVFATERIQLGDFDDAFYREEKDIFCDVDVFRVGLVLYYHHGLSDTEQAELAEWWAARPRPMMDRSG